MDIDKEFRNLIQTKKGTIGQKIYRNRMAKLYPNLKLYPYGQQNKGSHMFDGIVVKNGNISCLYDVKTKPRRYKYQDTGIDYYSYKNYMKSSQEYNKPFVLVFVDQYTGQIYYGDLGHLSKKRKINGVQYPFLQITKNGDNIIYFPLSQMNILDNLTEKEKKLIQSNASMNDFYKHCYKRELKTVKQILMEK